MNLKLHPSARVDLRRHIDYLAAAGVPDERLRQFYEAVQEALAKIERNPRVWSFAPGSRRVRKVQIPQFRLRVFYLTRTMSPPLILEVAGPGLQARWRKRV